MGLGVKVMTVNHKHHLVNTVYFSHQLSSLERCESLACSRGVPNVTILIGILNTIKYSFHSIELIRTQHHKTFIALVQNNILAYHLAKITLIKEEASKLTEIIKRNILCVCPVKRELIATVWIISKIARVHTIAYNKQLNIVE